MNLETDVLACVCLHLRRAARQMTQRYDLVLRPSGLKVTQFTLLAAVDRMGQASLNPLADLLGMDRTTLTRNLAVLRRRKLVEVERSGTDRREQQVSLTALGKAGLEQARPLWQEAQAGVLRQVKADARMPEGATLLRTLEGLGIQGR